MQLITGAYSIVFDKGGCEVKKGGETLYFNHRPIYVSVKTYGAMSEFRDCAYQQVQEENGIVRAEGRFTSDNGSVFLVRDLYTVENGALKIDRETIVEKKSELDLGFQTKIFFYTAQSDQIPDYYCFSPGQWYRHNEFASSRSLGKRLDYQYYWRKETFSGLPMFALQNVESGETISFSRWAANATLPSLDRVASENYAYVDPKMTVGSFGISKAKPEAVTYTYYGYPMYTPLPRTRCDGLSIDYIYPGAEGQMPARPMGPFNAEDPTRFISWQHPVREGFAQHYAVAVTFGRYDSFQAMMKATWREAYPRLKDRLFDVDNGLLFNNMMKFLKAVTRNFGKAWGTPFVAQLPDFDPNSFSAEIGFVGQQTGIGYQLLRWGIMNDDPEAVQKGLGILNFWVGETMTDTGDRKSVV